MSEKTAVSRDDMSFMNVYTYRELTYRLAYARFEEEPADLDALFEELKAKATEQDVIYDTVAILQKMGIDDSWVTSKVETFLIPETLNTVTRGIATKDGKEVRFFIERP